MNASVYNKCLADLYECAQTIRDILQKLLRDGSKAQKAEAYEICDNYLGLQYLIDELEQF